MKELLTPADIAARLGVTTARVYQLLGEGLLPFIRIGRSLRIPKQAWELWLEEQNTQARAKQHHEGRSSKKGEQ